jgi:bifunctional non-homologous end joining protein LigD
MHVTLRGKKLKGEWILVKDRREEDSNKWLLIKAGKAQTLSAKADDQSAISGRTMKQIAKDNDAQWQSNTPAEKHARKGRSSHRIVEPAFVEPMKCKAVVELPGDGEWTFEIKFDGYRCIAVKSGRKVTLFSRNEKKLNARFPLLSTAFSEHVEDFAMDGEIVALDEKGRPSFQLLQNSESGNPPIFFYAFDLVNRAGEDLRREPIERRRELLQEVLASMSDPIRLSPLLAASTDQILEAVKKLGIEGVVGKRRGSIYEPDERSGAWIKKRINREQEFVIGGFVPGSRGFDSLVVGVYENKKLNYVAKVKDGFVPRIRDDIFPAIKKLQTDICPFTNLPEERASRWGEALTAEKMKECRWVKPSLVCQVAFVEWTDGGKLRHCSFVAMRDDKTPKSVVRES